MYRAGVTIKFSKCIFFKDSVKDFGHIIRPGTLVIYTIRKKALKEAKHLRTCTGVSFRDTRLWPHHLLSLSRMELPKFGIFQSAEFHALIEAVTAPLVPALPKPRDQFILDTDACDYQIGCALFQLQEGQKKLVGYWSRTLQPAERNYCVTENKCLSAVLLRNRKGMPFSGMGDAYAATLRSYLLGDEFVLNMDHCALKWLMTVQNPSGGLLRWRLRL